ncbi:MAG: ABC transporter permease [Lachnospiraceae bacterium]|nr:ABC transporter permease [Butyrivibrio sp.]MCM1411837.1 ABC transporter permease [Lachnospiraceae bacterium]
MKELNSKDRGKKIRNPLVKRIPRELLGDWRKYLVVGLFLILTIGFVSGMYVANESMMTAADESVYKYRLESGHFELEHEADGELLTAIASGEMADVKQYYLDKAKEELDEKFEDEFEKEFNDRFGEEFALKFTERFDPEFQAGFDKRFDAAFEMQVISSLMAQGLGEGQVQAMAPGAVAQAKQTAEYRAAYDTAYEEAYHAAYEEAYDAAYEEAYQPAYDEAYQQAYEEAWEKIQEEIEEKYADAEEKYGLDDPDFQAVPGEVYENFYRNEEEDHDNDGVADGTIRVYVKTEDVNLACLMEGSFPVTEEEIAIDRMHADNAGIRVGDTITVSGQPFRVVGLIAYVNYSTLHEKNTDLIFDALKFDVAMVTESGFGRLDKTIHYAYAWQYAEEPADEKEEKILSDNFLKALLTQTVVADNEIEDYIPRYANQAINFATDDMGSDEAMGGVLLDILIVIIAFIFAVTISNTIAREAQTIGTLRASGYSRGELVRHYLSMPVIVTLIAAVIGNVLGYTAFKNVVVSMYYNSYSLPAYATIWNPEAFVKTTLIPVALMFVVNLAVIMKMMGHTPLQFLRRDLKKTKRKKAMRLPAWKFFGRFRLRIMLQNIPNYLILFLGVAFIMVMLAMAVGMPDTLKFYKDNAADMMFARYQYVLKSYEDEDGDLIETESAEAEKFAMKSLLKKSDMLDEEISIYGISDGSRYVVIDGLQLLKEGEVYISASFGDKYGLEAGDVVSLDEKYESMQYQFTVAGIYDKCQSLAVFMPIQDYRTVFDLEEDAFGGYMSDTEITDIEEENIATVLTERDITKMCDQLDHSMGAYMQYFQYLCILLSAVLIYLLTKIIIEKNENAISMTKILGYENGEIASLYLLSTTMFLVVADALGVVLGRLVMGQAWKTIMFEYSGWFTFVIRPAGYVKMFAFVLIGYLIVMVFDFRRIRKIPMEEALKNVE